MQAVCTIAAITAGGVWFYVQGAMRPGLKIEHRVSSRVLAEEAGDWLVGIDVHLENVGHVPANLPCGRLWVFDINPGDGGPESRLYPGKDDEQCLPDRRLEPGEGDDFHLEITVPAKTRTLKLHSFYPNLKSPKKGMGWEYFTLFDLTAPVENPKPSSSRATASKK